MNIENELNLEEFQEIESDFQDITENTFSEQEPEQPTRGANSIISAEFAAEIIDVIFPGLVQVGFGLMGRKVRMQDLKASKFEKENMVIPCLEDYLKTIDVSSVSPLEKLIIALCVVYGTKAVSVYPHAEKVQKNEAGEPKIERRGRPRKNT